MYASKTAFLPILAVPENKKAGIPPINLEDGPQGVADGASLVTAWPSALTVTMTWDVSAMEQWGAAMGAEQTIKGTNVMLGPAVNLARVPWAGRNFEYMGEWPNRLSDSALLISPPPCPSQAKTPSLLRAWWRGRWQGFRATTYQGASSTGSTVRGDG